MNTEDRETREMREELRALPLSELLQMRQATVEFLEILDTVTRQKTNRAAIRSGSFSRRLCQRRLIVSSPVRQTRGTITENIFRARIRRRSRQRRSRR